MIWTLDLIEEITRLRYSGLAWNEIKTHLGETYPKMDKIALSSIRASYSRHKDKYGDTLDDSLDDSEKTARLLKSRQLARTNAALARKETKAAIQWETTCDEFLLKIKSIISELAKTKKKPKLLKKEKKSSKKKDMKIELIISDIQYGKLTEKFDLKIARERVKEVADQAKERISEYSKNFNVELIQIGLLGDIIESATMHGVESARAVEVGNGEQIRVAIISLYEDLLMPLLSLNIPILVYCIAGNHDRLTVEKTLNYPGKEYISWVIYHVLQELSKVAGYKNITFIIPEGVYIETDIYGHTLLYEHGDHVKAITEGGMSTHVAMRSRQIGKPITYFRIGHWHKLIRYGEDELVVNGSVCGGDSYSDIRGFSTRASQLLLAYVRRTDNKLPFYESFPIQLEHIVR